MLQSSRHDARRNTDLTGENFNSRIGSIPFGQKTTQRGRRNQFVPGKGIGFFLFLPIQAIALDKNLLATMLDDVARFMEERKPQMVVALVAQAQLDDGLFAQPPRSPINA